MKERSELYANVHPWEKADPLRETQATLILGASIFFVPSAARTLFPSLSSEWHLLCSSFFALAAFLFLAPRETGIHLPRRLDILCAILGVLLLRFLSDPLLKWWADWMACWDLEPDTQPILEIFQETETVEKVLIFLSSALFTPLVEELFFRRLLYGFLLKINVPAAVILSALIFAVVHFFLFGLPSLFLYGIVFQLLFLATKNLTTPILAHFLLNSITLLSLW